MENQVNNICASVPPQCWGHYPGKENPARTMTASELSRNRLWLSGPDWLCTSHDRPDKEEMDTDTEVPQECRHQMKSEKAAYFSVVAQGHGPCIGQLTSCKTSILFTDYCACIEICTPPSSEGKKLGSLHPLTI